MCKDFGTTIFKLNEITHNSVQFLHKPLFDATQHVEVPFSKLKDTKKINPNGNGLGLNICKMLCRKLGGDITVSSRPNEWTEFTFWVNVKICEDCDIIDAISSRPAMQVRDLPKYPGLPDCFFKRSPFYNVLFRKCCVDFFYNGLKEKKRI